MDPEAFLDIANQVIKLKMFPYFDIAHCVLCALHVREDLGPGELRRLRAPARVSKFVALPRRTRPPRRPRRTVDSRWNGFSVTSLFS